MKISELKEPIKSWAEENVRLQPDYGENKDILIDAFDWYKSKEGDGFWNDVNDVVLSIEELRSEYPQLPWDEEPKTDSDFPFKVGDWIIVEGGDDGDQGRITAIGDDFFLSVNIRGNEDCHYKDDPWELYTPEKEKDLAGLKGWVVVRDNNSAMLIFSKGELMGVDLIGAKEVISLKEAKERGFEPLKLL